jgi:hypothetical protein
MTAGSIRHDGTVLTGVKAKPFGWPPASPDPGSGRRILATIEAAAPTPTKIKFQLRGVSTVRGDCRVRVQFAKVAEFQRRGIIHFHALIRLDGPPTDAEAYPPPAVDLDSGVLVNLVRSSAVDIWYDAPPLDQDDARRRLRFGAQLDAQPVTGAADRNTHSTQLHPETVAAYIAKYATKAAGDLPTDQQGRNGHLARLKTTVGQLARRASWTALSGDASPYAAWSRYVDMLGFRGHFATKSHRYSTTLGRLRQVRRDYTRRHHRPDIRPTEQSARVDLDQVEDEDTTLVIGSWRFAGMGWLTTGDAALAMASAARARDD